MADDKIAKPTGGSSSSPAQGRTTVWAAAHSRWRFFSRRYRVATTAALVSTVVLVCFSVVKTGVASTIMSALAVLASLASILNLFQIKLPRLPPISPKVTEGVVESILAMNILVGTVWGLSSYHKAHQAVDVLAKIALSGNVDMHSDDAPATLDVPVIAQRDGIVLVLQVVDNNPDGGNCTPYAEFLVTRRLGGNAATSLAAVPGRPVRVDLPPGSTNIHLDITLRDTQRIRNCGVDLRVTSAKLKNG